MKQVIPFDETAEKVMPKYASQMLIGVELICRDTGRISRTLFMRPSPCYDWVEFSQDMEGPEPHHGDFCPVEFGLSQKFKTISFDLIGEATSWMNEQVNV